MTHGSLFSGIGGFDLAAEWMGWENVFNCEWNEFGQKILKHYWPNAISYGDITKTDFTVHRGRIDIVSGGFPCQGFSLAGTGHSSLQEWNEMYRAIKEIQPPYVVGENVYGLIVRKRGLVFEQVQADLENIGYQVQPYLLPAAGVAAPHKRERVWITAYSEVFRKRRLSIQQRNQGKESADASGIYKCGSYTHSAGARSQNCKKERQQVSERSNLAEQLFPRMSWERFPLESPVYDRNDGVSFGLDTSAISESQWRTEGIKAAGNAIVPQVAFEIFKAIEKSDQNSILTQAFKESSDGF